MKHARYARSTCGWFVVATLSTMCPLPIAFAAPPPNPCKLITITELTQIVGPLKGTPTPGDFAAGDISCEYAPTKGPRWIDIRIHDGPLSAWKSRNGGSHPVNFPELGKDAFANPDADGSADLYVKKGDFILRVSMPKEPTSVQKLKAIAVKALPRL